MAKYVVMLKQDSSVTLPELLKLLQKEYNATVLGHGGTTILVEMDNADRFSWDWLDDLIVEENLPYERAQAPK